MDSTPNCYKSTMCDLTSFVSSLPFRINLFSFPFVPFPSSRSTLLFCLDHLAMLSHSDVLSLFPPFFLHIFSFCFPADFHIAHTPLLSTTHLRVFTLPFFHFLCCPPIVSPSPIVILPFSILSNWQICSFADCHGCCNNVTLPLFPILLPLFQTLPYFALFSLCDILNEIVID